MKHLCVLLLFLSSAFIVYSNPIPGAHQWDKYKHLLQNKRVGIVANATSTINDVHLVDFLHKNKIDIRYIFAPEHGFRGDKDPGEKIHDTIDPATKIPVIGLYGKNKQPTDEQMKNLDIIIFDIQDVGVRFYTYITSMHYVMNACAQHNKDFLVLDRPNPLGEQVDGPVLLPEFKSFVGMHPIPVVHGLTIGELACMINEEAWLDGGKKINMTVILVDKYTHATKYELPIKPSPNLPNYLSVRLYPSLCFFEATKVSIGRGTDIPFQIYGYPSKKHFGSFTFIPQDKPGMMMNPPAEGLVCYGTDLRNTNPSDTFTLKYLIEMQELCGDSIQLITNEKWFNLLAGNNQLIKQIQSGMSEAEIRKTWQAELTAYKAKRAKYLLYPLN